MSCTNDPTCACGCCSGVGIATPAAVANRPGLSAVAYRVGAHSDFKASLLARLSAAGFPALRELRTRDDDDFTIALIDAFATMADVLTFYQERIANESYLRTATERRSVLELARLIGYELRPGVAAETRLAFTIEPSPGAFVRAANPAAPQEGPPEQPTIVPIAKGTKVQSVPGPGEQAQMFETVEAVDARAAWNAVRPRIRMPQVLQTSLGSFYISGTNNDVKKGDRVLVIDSAGRAVKIVRAIATDETNKITRVDVADTPFTTIVEPGVNAVMTAAEFQSISAALAGQRLSDSVIDVITTHTWREADLATLVARETWNEADLAAAVAERVDRAAPEEVSAHTFRQRASVFGHTAPNWGSLPALMRFPQRIAIVDDTGKDSDTVTIPPFPSSWEWRTIEDDATPKGTQRLVHLDHQYEQLAPGGWVALEAPEVTAVPIVTTKSLSKKAIAVDSHKNETQSVGGQLEDPDRQIVSDWMPVESGAVRITSAPIVAVAQVSHSAFTISGKSTRLTIEHDALDDFLMRTTTVHVQSERLPLSPLRITTPVSGNRIVLDAFYLGLKIGQTVILTGERTDVPGAYASEVKTIEQSIIDRGFSVITFAADLKYSYVRSTVTINANVARSTHGETVTEVMGSGDASQPFQRFVLRQPPLTYVAAQSETGAASTLEVRVNDLLWAEVPSFYAHGPDERIYVTRLGDDGNTTVIFGDGRTGARIPTGENNVTAKYRRGIGSAGLVKATAISQLMSRPLGLKGATNPTASENAGDPETLASARDNASLTALTLGRVVSLQDYEDFARAYNGVAKAEASWVWNGEQRHVVVTIAGPKGTAINPGTDLYKALLGSLRDFGDPFVPLHLLPFASRWFRLTAQVKVDPAYLSEKVFAAIDARLRADFSFEARRFGEAVEYSEVVGAIQNIGGVIAVNVRDFAPTDADSTRTTPTAPIGALRPTPLSPASLVMIDSRPVPLEEMP